MTTARPADFDLDPADLALLAAGDLPGLLARHPGARGWRAVVRGGRVTFTHRLRTAVRADRKQVIPARPGESAWDALLRLGAQAAINRCVVKPLAADLSLFAVTSQEPGSTDRYIVAVRAQSVCTCHHGRWQPDRPCGHLGAVYLHLLRMQAAAANQRERAASVSDLFGAAA